MKRLSWLFAAMVVAGCSEKANAPPPQANQPVTAAGGAMLINGAGSTFAAPLYTRWAYSYHQAHPTVQVNYQAIGSGGGIQQITNHTVDFGASDAFLTEPQKAKAPGLMNVPTALGAVVVAYNVPELAGQELKLDGAVLANLFLGKVKAWNDPAIAALNPGLKLPATPVVIAHRADGSGTTAIFTDYLGKVSPEWKQTVGSGTSVKWPTGLGGKGNDGVSGAVKQSPGGVGYVELAYAEQNHLPMATLENADGKFVKASVETTSAAAAQVSVPDDFSVSVTNAKGEKAWPITGFTYLLLYPSYPDAKDTEMLRFFYWGLTQGQELARALDYAPLPESVQQKVVARLKAITVGGQPVELGAPHG